MENDVITFSGSWDQRSSRLRSQISSENLICSLFTKQATENIQKIFSKYGNKVKSSKQLTDII